MHTTQYITYSMEHAGCKTGCTMGLGECDHAHEPARVRVGRLCVCGSAKCACVWGGGLRRARKGQEYQHEQESVKN